MGRISCSSSSSPALRSRRLGGRGGVGLRSSNAGSTNPPSSSPSLSSVSVLVLCSAAVLEGGLRSSTAGFGGAGGAAEDPPGTGRLGRSPPEAAAIRSRFRTGFADRLGAGDALLLALLRSLAGLLEGREGGATKRGLSCSGLVAPEVVTIFSGPLVTAGLAASRAGGLTGSIGGFAAGGGLFFAAGAVALGAL